MKSRSGTSKSGTNPTSISGPAAPTSRPTSSCTTTPPAPSKAVNSRIRVGGPATAQAAWVGDMIAHAATDNVPLDFVSTHVYGNDTSKDVFGDDRPVPPRQMVCAAVAKIHDQIKASARPTIPLIWSEFNATYANEQPITDSIYMGPWLADTIRQCDGKVDIMSYWTFSDVFEEQGVIKTPFYGGYGIVAERGIPKPAFRAFEILHGLGDQRIAASENDVLATRARNGALAIALWNLVEPAATGPDRTFTLDIKGAAGRHVTIRRVDAAHGDTLTAWKNMDSPRYSTQAQIAALKKASEIGAPETISLHGDQLTVTVPPKGLALVEIH